MATIISVVIESLAQPEPTEKVKLGKNFSLPMISIDVGDNEGKSIVSTPPPTPVTQETRIYYKYQKLRGLFKTHNGFFNNYKYSDDKIIQVSNYQKLPQFN